MLFKAKMNSKTRDIFTFKFRYLTFPPKSWITSTTEMSRRLSTFSKRVIILKKSNDDGFDGTKNSFQKRSLRSDEFWPRFGSNRSIVRSIQFLMQFLWILEFFYCSQHWTDELWMAQCSSNDKLFQHKNTFVKIDVHDGCSLCQMYKGRQARKMVFKRNGIYISFKIKN